MLLLRPSARSILICPNLPIWPIYAYLWPKPPRKPPIAPKPPRNPADEDPGIETEAWGNRLDTIDGSGIGRAIGGGIHVVGFGRDGRTAAETGGAKPRTT